MMNQHCKGTWPGSTSSRVAPWVARTAAAIASITLDGTDEDEDEGDHQIRVIGFKSLWPQK